MKRRNSVGHAASVEDDLFAKSLLRLVGVALIGVKLAVVPLAFDPSVDMPFVVPKAVLSYALSCALAGTLLGLFVSYGRRALFRPSPLHAPVVAFLVVSGVATILGVDLELALYGTHARMLGLISILDNGLLYFAIVFLVRARSDVLALVGTSLSASVIVLGYEAVQVLGRDPFVWSNADPTRPFATFGEATALANYLTVCTLGVSVFAGLARLTVFQRSMLLGYSAILLWGVLATGTRASLVGLVTGAVVALTIVWLAHPVRRVRQIGLAAAVLTFVAVTTLVLVTPLGARIVSTLEPPSVEAEGDIAARLDPSTEGRLSLYLIGLRIVMERPLLGYGPDSFVIGVPRYRPDDAPRHIQQTLASSPHSWLLHVATGTGLLGLACFVSIAVLAFALAARRSFRSAAVAASAMLAGFLGTGLTSPNEFGTEWLFWLGASVIAVATQSAVEIPQAVRRPSRARSEKSAVRMRSASWAILAVAALIGATGVVAMDASRSAQRSRELRSARTATTAVALATRAVRLDPRRGEYWDLLGLAHVAGGHWQDAAVAFEQAAEQIPYDVRFIGDWAGAELLLGNAGDSSARVRARELADKAIRVDPNNPRSHLTRALVLRTLGDRLEALRSAQRALALDHNSVNETLYVVGVQLLRETGQPKESVELGRSGLALLSQITPALDLRIELARSLLLLGEPSQALTEVDLVLAFRPEDSEANRLRTEIVNLLRQ